MRFNIDGKLTGDPKMECATIAKRAGVNEHLVYTVMTLRTPGKQHDERSLLRLADHFAAGARKETTPAEHRRLLQQWAHNIADHIETIRAARDQMAAARPKAAAAGATAGTTGPAPAAPAALAGGASKAQTLTPAQLRIVCGDAKEWIANNKDVPGSGKPLRAATRQAGERHARGLTKARDGELLAGRKVLLETLAKLEEEVTRILQTST